MNKITNRTTVRMTARCRRVRREKGVVAIQVAFFLVMLLSVAALALDVGRWVVVRHELQNAADAAALAGAHELPGQLVASAPSDMWTSAADAASAAATTYASANSANGQAASAQTVLVGYWDVNRANVPSTVPSSLSQTISSPTDKPAVIATVGLTDGANLPLVLGPLLGVSSLKASATAVAIVSVPGAALPGALFPMVLNQCIYTNPIYWSNGQPVPGMQLQMGDGAATTIAGTTCQSAAGQWTTLNDTACGSIDSVPAVQCLMQNGNSNPLTVTGNANTPCPQQPASCTYVQPGTKAELYNSSNYPTLPIVVTVPVVADGATALSGSSTPILGFASFSIDAVYPAGTKSPCAKCIVGHLVSGVAGSTTAGGTTSNYFGAVTPPSLAVLPTSAYY